MVLLSGGFISVNEFKVFIWVIICCVLVMVFGIFLGGKKIIKIMGSGMVKLILVNGFVV